jgi:hypothetical protein
MPEVLFVAAKGAFIMDRRHIATRFIPWLVPVRHRPQSFRAIGPRMAGRAFSGLDATPHYLTVIAWNERSSFAAENRRLALLEDAGRTSPGMGVNVSTVRGHALPADLDHIAGSVISWATTGGNLTANWAAGYFRRGRVTWEIVASGRDIERLVRVVIDPMADLSRREPLVPDAEGVAGSLWDLLPVASDFGAEMTLEATFEDPADDETVATAA